MTACRDCGSRPCDVHARFLRNPRSDTPPDVIEPVFVHPSVPSERSLHEDARFLLEVMSMGMPIEEHAVTLRRLLEQVAAFPIVKVVETRQPKRLADRPAGWAT